MTPRRREVVHDASAGRLDRRWRGVGLVAQILDVPEGTIRSRVFHARRRLRELLAEEARRG